MNFCKQCGKSIDSSWINMKHYVARPGVHLICEDCQKSNYLHKLKRADPPTRAFRIDNALNELLKCGLTEEEIITRYRILITGKVIES